MSIFTKFILVIILPSLLLSNALGEGMTSRDIEKALGTKAKEKAKCALEPCSTEVDQLLEILGNDETSQNQVSSGNKEFELSVLSSDLLQNMNKAQIVILNKITAKSEQVIFDIGQVKFFGNLSIEVHKCIQSTDPYKPNNLMLLTIFDIKLDEDQLPVFHGWVATSNPSLSTLEHPVYEVIPQTCLTNNQKPIPKK